jgi:hypothetical protein
MTCCNLYSLKYTALFYQYLRLNLNLANANFTNIINKLFNFDNIANASFAQICHMLIAQKIPLNPQYAMINSANPLQWLLLTDGRCSEVIYLSIA